MQTKKWINLMIGLMAALVLSACGGGGSQAIDLGRLLLSADGTKAYIADHNVRGLRIVNISNAASPEQISSVTSLKVGKTHTYGIALSPDGKKVYMGVGDHNALFNKGGAVVIFDVSDASSATMLGSYRTEDYIKYRYNFALSPDGKTLFGILSDGNVTYLDVSDAAHPVLSKNIDTFLSGPCVSNTADTRVYCAQQIIDVNVPEKSHHEDISLHQANEAMTFSSDDQRVVTVSYSTLSEKGYIKVYDTTDIDDPALLKEYTENDAEFVEVAVAPDRSRIYVLDKAKGLKIFDLNDTGDLTEAGSYAFGSSGLALSADGTKAYVTDGENGMKILDVTDPADIRLLGTYK